MMIDKVSGVGPGYEPRKNNPASRNEGPARAGDNVTISEEASRAALAARTARTAQTAQDPARADKLKEVKARLQRGEYDNPSEEVLSHIAGALSDSFISGIQSDNAERNT